MPSLASGRNRTLGVGLGHLFEVYSAGSEPFLFSSAALPLSKRNWSGCLCRAAFRNDGRWPMRRHQTARAADNASIVRLRFQIDVPFKACASATRAPPPDREARSTVGAKPMSVRASVVSANPRCAPGMSDVSETRAIHRQYCIHLSQLPHSPPPERVWPGTGDRLPWAGTCGSPCLAVGSKQRDGSRRSSRVQVTQLLSRQLVHP